MTRLIASDMNVIFDSILRFSYADDDDQALSKRVRARMRTRMKTKAKKSAKTIRRIPRNPTVSLIWTAPSFLAVDQHLDGQAITATRRYHTSLSLPRLMDAKLVLSEYIVAKITGVSSKSRIALEKSAEAIPLRYLR